METGVFSRLAFAAFCNVRNEPDDGQRVGQLLSEMQHRGAFFVAHHASKSQAMKVANKPVNMDDASGFDWAGRLYLSPKVFDACLQEFALEGQKRFAKVRADAQSIEVVRGLREVFVTIDIPAKGIALPYILTYWTARPTFWPIETDKGLIETNIDGRSATDALVFRLHGAAHKDFAGFLLGMGMVDFCKDEPKELGFVHIVTTRLAPPDRGEGDFASLYEQALYEWRNGPIRVHRISKEKWIVFSRGFVRRKGELGDAVPDSFLLATIGPSHDEDTVQVLRRLANVQKSGALLNNLGDFDIPSLELAGDPLESSTSFEEGNSLANQELFRIAQRTSLYVPSNTSNSEIRNAKIGIGEVHISNREKLALHDAFSTLREDLFVNFEEFSARAFSIIYSLLSPSTIDAIRALRFDMRSWGAVLLHGLPVDSVVPPTPTVSMLQVKKPTHISEACLLGIGQFLGQPFGFADEKKGEIIHNIHPVKGKESSKSNEGSRTDFQLHTEIAFHPLRPHYILLYCLRADHDRVAITRVVDVRAAYNGLKIGEIADLRQAQFIIRPPESFRAASENIEPQAVLSGFSAELEACLNFNTMKALTERAEAALNHLRELLNQISAMAGVRLEPGQMLIVNNTKAVHGRTSFEPRFDGEDRWLQRLYVRQNLWNDEHGLGFPNRVVPSAGEGTFE